MIRVQLLLPLITGILFFYHILVQSFGHGVIHNEIDGVSCLIEQLPDDPDLYLKRGNLWLSDESWDEALADFEQAEKIAGEGRIEDIHLKFAKALFGKALSASTLRSSSFLQEALMNLDEHLEIDFKVDSDAQVPEALLIKAKVLGKLQDFKGATVTYINLLDLLPEPSADYYIQIAEWLESLGDIDGALAQIDDAIERLGLLSFLQLCAIDIAERHGRIDEAVRRVNTLIDLPGRKESYYTLRGDIEHRAGRLSDAFASYHLALDAIDSLPAHIQNRPFIKDLLIHIQQVFAEVLREHVLVLYKFDEGSGDRVGDSSFLKPALDLFIEEPSAVDWRPGGTLELLGPTKIISAGPASKVIDAVKSRKEITILAWITPANNNQSGPGSIVTLSKSTQDLNLSLSQNEGFYDAHIRTSENTGTMPSLASAPGTVVSEPTMLVFNRDVNGNGALYINEKRVATEHIPGSTEVWDPMHPLGIANDLLVERPWSGQFHLIAILDFVLVPTDHLIGELERF